VRIEKQRTTTRRGQSESSIFAPATPTCGGSRGRRTPGGPRWRRPSGC